MAFGGIFGRGTRMPNMGGRELNEFTSWKTISQGLTNAANYANRIEDIRAEFKWVGGRHRDVSDHSTYGRFSGGLQGVIGTLGGKLGRDIDGAIKSALRSIDLKGGHRIAGGDLSKILDSLQKSIDRISNGTGGVEGKLIAELSKKMGAASKSAEKGGFHTLGGGARDAIHSAFGFKGNAAAEDAVKGFASEIKKASGSISSAGLKQAVEQVKTDMLNAAKAAKTVAEKQQVLANAGKRLNTLKGTATGDDRTLIDGLAKTASKNSGELAKHIAAQQQQFRRGEFTNKVENLSRALGASTSLLRPLKRSLDLGNQIFQNFNSKFNQFARMQMRIASERGGFGRQLRGAGIDYGHMMGALAAGRRAGMDDRSVINQMVDLQTQLAQARWGEGELIKNAGRWGISTYDVNGDVKEAHQLMIDFSNKLNSLGSRMEKLQFLHHIGMRPEQMPYVAGYAKEAKRQDFLSRHPEMRGTLDNAKYLDESGLSAKADAYTRVELRRREVLNANAIEEGIIPGLKRSLNPENWLFSDWTARQQGMKQAKGDKALEKLTRAIEARVAQEKEKGKGGPGVGALSGLTPADLAAISEIAKADKADKGEKSGAALIDKAYLDQFGIKLDVRTPIEKLQGALEPLTAKIADGVEWIVEHLGKSSLVRTVVDNPGKSIMAMFAMFLGYKAFGKTLGGFFSRSGGKLADKVFSGSAAKGAAGVAAGGAGAAAKEGIAGAAATGASKPGLFSRIGGWFSRPGGKTAATVAGGAGTAASAEASLSALNKSFGLGLNIGSGAKGAAGFEAFIAENQALASGAAKAAGGAAGKGAAGAAAKGGLKRLGGPILGALYFGYDAYSAMGQYEQGDIKGGNNTIASSAGGILGGMAGGALAGAAAGSWSGPGAIVTGLVGAIVGGVAGALGGGAISDALSEHYEVRGSEAWRKRNEGFRSGDTVVRDPEEATKHFLNGLREALRNNNTQRAMEILTKNGIHGLDLEALKADEGFMKDDTKAQQALHGAIQAQALSQYAYLTGKSISMEDFVNAASTDKYLQTASQLGMQMSPNEAVYAAMRGTGNGGPGPGFDVMHSYMKNGWKTNKEAIQNEETAIRNENPEMRASEVRKEAERRVKEQHLANLTSEDMQNYANSLQEEGRLVTEHAKLVDEAGRFGITSTGMVRNSKGELVDAEGYLVDSNGARIDREGRHEGEEGYEATRARAALQGKALEAYNRLQNFRKANIGADEMTLNQYDLDNWGKIANSPEAAQKAALSNMKRMGMDVGNRGFGQMFESEQLKMLEEAIYNSSNDMSVGGRLAKFANENGISLDQARNMLGKVGIRSADASEQVHLGSDAKNKEKARKTEKKKKDRKKENAELAKMAGDDEVFAAIKDDADVEYYDSLQEKIKKGGILTDKEQEFVDQKNAKIASKVRAKQRKAASKALHAEPSISKAAQADIDNMLRNGMESKKAYDAARKKRPLAELSDMRQIDELRKKGMSQEELTRRFGRDRVAQYQASNKSRFNPKMTREEAEERFREMAQTNYRKKEGESDEDYKKRIEEVVAGNMAGYDARTGKRKNKHTGRSGNKPGFPTEDATAVMKQKTDGVAQAADKMAAGGNAAEAAAASAKNAQGGGSTEKNVTINLGGQTINQQIQGNIPIDAEGIKGATAQAGDVVMKNLPAQITSVSEMKGLI